MTAMQKMTKARAALILDQRFFGSLALKLRMIEDPTCGTMWTDGASLGFNPDFVDSLSMDETKGIICHEVMHCAANHNTRRNEREHGDWNIAADYAINDIIKNSGLVLPKNALFDSRLKDKSADEIYTIVHGKKQQQENSNRGSTQNSQQGTAQGQGKGEENKPAKGQNTGDPGGCGEVRDFPGEIGIATETEKQQQAQDWKVATAQAANQAKGCGQLPGGLEELIKEMLEPKVSWKETLQRFVEQIARNDYTYQRPNARYAGQGIVMPSLFNKELPPIDIWVDTSGSVGTEEKKQFAGEINDIRGHYRTTIRVIFCDSKVQAYIIINPEDAFIELDCKGGGGTRFSPAIKWSMEQEEKPTCGIYLTDLCCNDFGPEPDFPVLWVQTTGRKRDVPFGEMVRMSQTSY